MSNYNNVSTNRTETEIFAAQKDALKVINELEAAGNKPWIVIAPDGDFLEEWFVVRNGVKSYYMRKTCRSSKTWKALAVAHKQQMVSFKEDDELGPKAVILD